MSKPADMVDDVRAVADPLLTSRRFRLQRDRYEAESFGSRCCEWSRGAERVRAVWDGKESWLVVVWSANREAPHPVAWDDVWIVRQAASESAEDFRRRVLREMPALAPALAARCRA